MVESLINGTTTQQIKEQLFQAEKNLPINIEFGTKTSLIISGEALFKIALNDKLKEMFLNVADKSTVVLACRVSPKQKADIVNMIRHRYPHKTTLSIGDGANDVNMITAANVGVGISGLEGQ